MVEHIKSLEELKAKFNSAEDKLVMVDFFAQWCGPCKHIAPLIEKMTTEFPTVIFLKVDVDEAQDAAEEYEISAMPSFLFFKNGNKVATVVGASEAKIRENLAKLK